MRQGYLPYASIEFIDCFLSELAQSLMAQQIPRLTLRKRGEADSTASGAV